jgi:segregation and condensation protein B
VAALAEASRDADAAADAEAAVEAGLDVTTDSEEVTVVPVETTAEGKVPGETTAEGEVPAEGEAEALAVDSAARLESILQSLLFASDRALGMSDLKRLLNQRDAKVISAALERLQERHRDTGIQLGSSGGGWQFRTHPENAPWVSKLIAGRPARLSRAMLETLAIVAYRQPITRPEIDEIRGVDCGPVLKTLLDRALIRMIGKKEEVGRPILYGTTPEFLRTFSLRDLNELPTLREFHELSEQQMASVDAQAPLPVSAQGEVAAPAGEGAEPPRSVFAPAPMDMAPVDQDEEDELIEALETATMAATRAAGPPPGVGAEASAPESSPEAQN